MRWGVWAGRDDGSSGPLGVAAPGRPLVYVVVVDLGLVRG